MYFVNPEVINRKPRGRSHGAKTQSSDSIRWGFVEAYRLLGGVEGLVNWGRANPSLFYPMLTKLLPSELAESGAGQGITVIVQRSTAQGQVPIVEVPSTLMHDYGAERDKV